MVLTEKQKHRSMQQNRKPKNEPTFIWSSNLQQKRQGYRKRKRANGSLSEGKGVGRREKYMREFEVQRKDMTKDEAS